MTSRLSLWQTKLKAAKAEQHQHEKMLRQQYRALERSCFSQQLHPLACCTQRRVALVQSL